MVTLVIGKESGDDDDDGQDDAQVEVVVLGFLDVLRLQGVGDQAQDGSGPQQKGAPYIEKELLVITLLSLS